MMEIKKDIIYIHHYFYRIRIISGFHLCDDTTCLTFSLTCTCTKGQNPLRTRIQFKACLLLNTQTKLHSYLNGVFDLVMLNFHLLSQCQLALDQPIAGRENKRQVQLQNHFWKTLVDPLKLINFKKSNLSLFLGIKLFEFNHIISFFVIMFLHFTSSLFDF